jgi:hypothetical protein
VQRFECCLREVVPMSYVKIGRSEFSFSPRQIFFVEIDVIIKENIISIPLTPLRSSLIGFYDRRH